MKLSFLRDCVILLLILFSFCPAVSFCSSADDNYEISVYINKDKKIKQLSLEKYVCGVLKGEISSKWSLRALRAQAVLARTYAFNRLEKEQGSYLDDSISQQVYKNGKIPASISQAVKDTKDEVLMYQGKLATVFYHSSSGGHTANIRDVWPGSENFPYLCGVDDHQYSCGPKKYYPWRRSFKLDGLSRKFSGLGKINGLKIVKKSASGRVKEMVVLGAKGRRSLTGKEFRCIMNLHLKQTDENYFPSTLFNWQIKNNFVIFTGYGSGHGVGLSQWGAKKMAEEGKTYDKILEYYFPGTEIGKVEIK